MDLIQIGGIVLCVTAIIIAIIDTRETGGKLYGNANTNGKVEK